jgi:ABC-type Mn2+/Zn2+ transport system ATPase subunit
MFSFNFHKINVFIHELPLIEEINANFLNTNVIHISGNNGVGKSSLFKSILGFQNFSYNGKFLITKGINDELNSYVYLPQENTSIEDVSVGEFIATKYFNNFNGSFLNWIKFSSYHKANWHSKFMTEDKQYLDNLNLSSNELFSNLNFSRKRFIELLRLPIEENDVVLLDEPFEGMDSTTLEYALSYINSKFKNNAILIIDHTNNYNRLEFPSQNLHLYDFDK